MNATVFFQNHLNKNLNFLTILCCSKEWEGNAHNFTAYQVIKKTQQDHHQQVVMTSEIHLEKKTLKQIVYHPPI